MRWRAFSPENLFFRWIKSPGLDCPNRGFLELLAKDFGEPCEAGLRLNLRLTHQEIASALSTTRVTVTRVLGQLRDEGWLQIDASRHLMVTGAGRR